jgi:uncharacterized RDD family membrane protein YckC
VEAAAGGVQHAGWWRRAGALIIDNFILSIPIVVGWVIVLVGSEAGGAVVAFGVLLIVLGFLLPFFYFPYLHSREHGQTLGKRGTGIAVRSEDGGRLSGGRALARYVILYLFMILLYVPLLVNYLWPIWDDRNQALHDKVARSIVVRA